MLPNTQKKVEIGFAGLISLNNALVLTVSMITSTLNTTNSLTILFQAVKLCYALLSMTMNLKK